jgi:pilus assembly protein CpaF
MRMVLHRPTRVRQALLPVRIGVLNRASGVESSFAVARNKIVVGRGNTLAMEDDTEDLATSYLKIPSKFISNPHVVLERASDGSWTAIQLGLASSTLNDAKMLPEHSNPMGLGDRLDLGEFTASLFAETIVTAAVEPGIDPVELLGSSESRIHIALLDAMDLRRSDRVLDLNSTAIQTQILDHLDILVAHEMTRMSAKELAVLAHVAVHRLLTYAATAAGSTILASKSSSLASPRGAPLAKARLDQLLKSLSNTLGLEMQARSLEEDVKKIDRGFETAMSSVEIEMGTALLSEIVSFYLRRSILDLIFGLGPLQDLMEMESISEIMVVARDQIFVEKFGVVESARRAFYSDDSLLAIIERIVAPIGRRVDKSSPMVDAHLPDGSRVNAIIPPLAIKGPCLTIRKFRKTPLTIDDLVTFGALTPTVRDFLRACVKGRKNVVVSGGTGSGKTTLLNCLSAFIGPKERIVTVEDTAELQLKQEHVVTLEGRPANMEGKGEVSIRDLVRNALRMRPDRVIVGECRGAEALDMLQAMNTGHDGSMTTGHANSPDDMVRRLETMVLVGVDMPISAIREQIVAAVDLIIQIQRESTGRRRVTHVSEIVGLDPQTGDIVVEDIFRVGGSAGGKAGSVSHTGYLPTFSEALLRDGHLNIGLFLGGS